MNLVIEKKEIKNMDLIRDLSRTFSISEEREKARNILCLVLHTLRDNISRENAIKLLSVLPARLKHLYYEGWQSSGNPDTQPDSIDLYAELSARSGRLARYDFPDEITALETVHEVFTVLKRHIPKERMTVIKMCLPANIRFLV